MEALVCFTNLRGDFMTNYKLETKREELKNKKERLMREIDLKYDEIKAYEDELEMTELLIRAVEKEMIDRDINLDQIDEANEW